MVCQMVECQPVFFSCLLQFRYKGWSLSWWVALEPEAGEWMWAWCLHWQAEGVLGPVLPGPCSVMCKISVLVPASCQLLCLNWCSFHDPGVLSCRAVKLACPSQPLDRNSQQERGEGGNALPFSFLIYLIFRLRGPSCCAGCSAVNGATL